MPFSRVDTLGVPVLVRGRSETRRVLLYDDTGTQLTIADGGTVTLTDLNGTSLGSGTTSSGAAVYTVSAGTTVGPGYETWAVTASGTAYTFRVRVLVGQADLPCPINDDDIGQVVSVLDSMYPVGETTWAKQIRRGWDRAMREVIRRTRANFDGELYASDDLYDAGLSAVIAQICLDASALGSARWADLATEWERRFQHAIESAMLRFGKDATAGPDTEAERMGSGAAVGERQFGRLG